MADFQMEAIPPPNPSLADDSPAAVHAPANLSVATPSELAPGTATRQRHPLPTAPLAVWLAIQLAALALAAARVPLAARYPDTGERLALDVVLVAQIAASSLLFPWILRDWTTATLSIALCWPVLALAVWLSGLPPARLPGAAGYATLWLLSLSAWRAALRSHKSQMIAAAVASAWAVGGPLLWYLRVEFTGSASDWAPPTTWFGPVAGALHQARPAEPGDFSAAGFWLVPAGVLAAGVTVVGIARLRAVRRRRRLTTAGLPRAGRAGQ